MDILSLYRSYLRQVSALPHVYLRQFFRVKGADDFRSVLKTNSLDLRRKKLKRVSKDLQRLRAANGGKSAAFDRVLDIAYGRVGKLRWELMEPLLSNPTPLRNEKTCFPAYSPKLAALLTSGISRTTRPLQNHHLAFPPGLPAHAKLDSEDATLLGPLSRRRKHNIYWRFFKSEWKKVYPPLQISPRQPANPIDTPISSNSYNFQNIVSLESLSALAGSPSSSPELTVRQRIQKTIDPNTSPFDGKLPLRWLRRRYQALLGRVPLLISRPVLQDDSKRLYDIQLADSAMSVSRPHSSRLRTVDAEDLWISDIHLAAQSGRRRR